MNFEPQIEQPSRCCGLLRKDTGVVFRLLQEDQLSSLDLVTNVIILWNTLYGLAGASAQKITVTL